jgi:hypothetical protein
MQLLSKLTEFQIRIKVGSGTRKVKKVKDPQKREKTYHVMKTERSPKG